MMNIMPENVCLVFNLLMYYIKLFLNFDITYVFNLRPESMLLGFPETFESLLAEFRLADF